MDLLFLLARRGNEELNRWLSENPLVLGGVFLLIGLAVGGWGLYELKKGVAYSKRGKVVEGTHGKALAIIRIVAGAGCILFAVIKMILG